jgi:hypothetical protein
MAKVDRYQEFVIQVIRDHARHQLAYGEMETQTIFDTERHHYQLVHAGWNNKLRQYGCLIHIDIKDEKIWIQQDGTEIGVANELVALGVPNSDIVLAYLSSFARQHTEFAVA